MIVLVSEHSINRLFSETDELTPVNIQEIGQQKTLTGINISDPKTLRRKLVLSLKVLVEKDLGTLVI